ncbi:MAG: HK97 family phage prohead protease [Pseudomonadota bacterium]
MTVKIEAPLTPRSLNEQAGTVDCVFASGQVFPHAFADIGNCLAQLATDTKAIKTDRFHGAPVLKDHDTSSVNGIVGTVLSSRSEGGKAIATIKIHDEETLAKVKAGQFRNVSIGLRLINFSDSQQNDGTTVRRLTEYEPYELSLVVTPADPGAVILSSHGANQMKTQATQKQPQLQTAAATEQELHNIAMAAALPNQSEWVQTQLTANATCEFALTAAQNAMRAAPPKPIIQTASQVAPALSTVGVDHEDPEEKRKRMAAGVYFGIHRDQKPDDAAREYIGLTLQGYGREMAAARGNNPNTMSPNDLYQLSMTTSDLPFLLQETGNRTARAGYESVEDGILSVSRELAPSPDYKPYKRLSWASGEFYHPKTEAGEYRSSVIREAKTSLQVKEYGDIGLFTRQMFWNDDLGVLDDYARRKGVESRTRMNQIAADTITANTGAGPVVEDGKTMFHSDHNNLDETPGTIDFEAIDRARKTMRRTKDLAEQLIAARPSLVVVPPELESIAEQKLAAIRPATTDDVNPFSSLRLIVDPFLTDPNAWYVVAENITGLEHAFLAGSEGPQIETAEDFETGGIKIRAHLDFGIGVSDFRGWYRNPGA